jgi:uncharacterized membrane protein
MKINNRIERNRQARTQVRSNLENRIRQLNESLERDL